MWEWKYAREPFDMKLLLIRLMQNIWIPIIAALLGAAIIGGGYFLAEDVFGGPDTYEVTSTYYVEYGKDPETGNDYTYINYASWDNWVKTDYFTENIWNAALEEGLEPEKFGIEKGDLKGFLSADLPSDLRMPTSTVKTKEAELTGILAKAVEKAFVLFGEEQREIDKLRVVDTTEVSLTDKDIRTLRACILGGVLAVFFALTGMLLYFIADDGIYLPQVFSCRYGIPALGTAADNGEGIYLLKGTAENVAYCFRDCKTVAVTAVEEETDLLSVTSLLEKTENKGQQYICIPSILQVPEAAEKLRETDGVLLLVKAGNGNGKQIEKALYQMKIQDCPVKGVLLTDGDEKLIRLYERTGYREGSR